MSRPAKRKFLKTLADEAEVKALPLRPLLTEPELADYFQKSLEAVRKARWRGEGPNFLKVSGSIRYRREDVLAYLQRCVKVPQRRIETLESESVL